MLSTAAQCDGVLSGHFAFTKNKNGATLFARLHHQACIDGCGGWSGPIVASAPGALWLIGNEPDRGPDPGYTSGGQDDTTRMYTRAPTTTSINSLSNVIHRRKWRMPGWSK